MRKKLLEFKREKKFKNWHKFLEYLNNHGLNITYSTLIAWSRPKTAKMHNNPGWENANKLAEILDCSLDDLRSEDNSEICDKARAA